MLRKEVFYMSKKYPDKFPGFGNKVREILKAKNITIEKFAEIIDITDNFVSKILAGYTPSFQSFLKIVDALGVSADYLIQDYLTTVPDEIINADQLNVIMSKSFSTLTKAQKEEILHLVNFLNAQNQQ
jgi:transcriptional regulator with XRE-family HTH domain